jgi:preprotein translocase subunit SecE
MADRIKIVLALLVLGGGLTAFYIYDDQSLLYRVVGLLVVVAIAVSIIMTSQVGKASWGFLQDARTEVRKVVWPTRKETSQTTLLIMISVVVVGLMLWGLDSLLLWGVQLLTGQSS